MRVLDREVRRYSKKSTGGHESSYITLSKIKSFEVLQTTGKEVDSFQMMMPNPEASNVGSIQVGDRIQIYMYSYGESPSISNLLIDGLITEFRQAISNKREYTVNGKGRLDALLNVKLPAGYLTTGSYNRSPLIIKNLVGLASDRSDAPITAELESLGGYIRDAPLVGSAGSYPIINFTRPYTSVADMLYELSNTEFTDDGLYTPWVDTENNLHWQPNLSTTSGSIYESQTRNTKVARGIWDVINALIFHAGEDAYGMGILDVATNDKSRALHGEHWDFRRIDKAGQLMIDERNLSPGSFTDESYPFPGSYPYTFNMESETGSILTATNNSDYNDDVRLLAREQAMKIARDMVDIEGGARFKCEFEMPFSLDYQRNALMYVSVPSQGWEGTDVKKLRIKKILHQLDSGGATTKLTLMQDPRDSLVID